MCNQCKTVIEDDFDECCKETYTEVYKCPECGDWVEELVLGGSKCKWCEEQMPEGMTWGMFYGFRRV